MQRLEVSGAVRPIYGSLGVKRLMYELKKTGKVFTSKSVWTGPSSYEKRIYRPAVSQRLRNTGLADIAGENVCIVTSMSPSPHLSRSCGSYLSGTQFNPASSRNYAQLQPDRTQDCVQSHTQYTTAFQADVFLTGAHRLLIMTSVELSVVEVKVSS